MRCFDVNEIADAFSLDARIRDRSDDETVTIAEYNDLVDAICEALKDITCRLDD